MSIVMLKCLLSRNYYFLFQKNLPITVGQNLLRLVLKEAINIATKSEELFLTLKRDLVQ